VSKIFLASFASLCVAVAMGVTQEAVYAHQPSEDDNLPGVEVDAQVASAYWGSQSGPSNKKCEPLWTVHTFAACPTAVADCTKHQGPCAPCECLGKGCVGAVITTMCFQVWQHNSVCCINKSRCILGDDDGCQCRENYDAVGTAVMGRWQC